MNGIMGMTQLALEMASSREQKQYLEIARDSANSLLGLLNDVLDLSRIEAGKRMYAEAVQDSVVPAGPPQRVESVLSTISFFLAGCLNTRC